MFAGNRNGRESMPGDQCFDGLCCTTVHEVPISGAAGGSTIQELVISELYYAGGKTGWGKQFDMRCGLPTKNINGQIQKN